MDGADEIVFQLTEISRLTVSSSTSSSYVEDTESSIENSNTTSSDEDDEDALLFPLIKYLTTGRRRNRIENYLNIVDSWMGQEFKEHLRLNRFTTQRLIDELQISNYLPSHEFGIKPISAKLSIIIFLWYMANTEPLRTIADRFNVSISSVFRILRRVITWLLTKLEHVIKWPQGQNVIAVTEHFRSKRGISNVLGAIDGTHIQIEKPQINARDYCNRKKYFSILLQAVVDCNMKFTNIYAGEPGSLHDARMPRRSPLYVTANENKEILFPHNTLIIGDSAHPSLPWLVPPFRDNGHLTAQQTEFNFIHSSTRMAVERAFGYLKGRFRRIKFFTEYRDKSFITNTIVFPLVLT